MKRYRARWILIATVIVMMALSGTAMCGDSQPERDSLKGLSAVMLVIRPLSAGAEKDGLHQADIRSDVQSKLTEAGLKVLNSKDRKGSGGMPELVVNVHAFKDRDGLYAFTIEVELKQRVSLLKSGHQMQTGTWSIQALGTIGAGRLNTVRDYITSGVDKFVISWREVNTKTHQP